MTERNAPKEVATGHPRGVKYCFVFVCQQGELEIKSLLLAASLKRFVRCDHELVAALPRPESTWGIPSPATLALLQELGVRTAAIENPIGPEYPIGNKLACLGIATDAEKIIFLDSDILLLREFHGDERFRAFAFNAKPADLATFGADLERWRRVYASCGQQLPTTRVCSTVSGEPMPPYFNAGVIAARRGAGLASTWIACARAIDADASIPDKRPWLDQIALPVALDKLGLATDCLDERYNYPAHLKPLAHDNLPYFCHYHSADVLRRELPLRSLVSALAREYPTLRDLIEATPAWRSLAPPAKHGSPLWTQAIDFLRGDIPSAAPVTPSFLITGIPRSGTSFLCKLAHAAENCVVINEPAEIFAPLSRQANPWGVATYYGELRRDILDGKPIMNKLFRGEFIEDTARVDTQEPYVPQISRPDFLLGTKNTLAYLARLPQLRRVMPEATIAACVRHPLDTIASWKTAFPHLAEANLEIQAVGHSRDPMLTGAQRQRVEEIAATTQPALRRALMWKHLAELILENRHHLKLLRYEDVVIRPIEVLRDLFASIPRAPALKLPSRPAPSAPRHKREILDADDLVAIRGICGQAAAELGYERI